MSSVPVLNRFCRECYSDPVLVYSALKERGMDLVTIIDHDSIDAAESLRRYSDFFLSQELTCSMPSGTKVHIGVYDIQDRHHIELQRRRNDLPALLAFLAEQKLFFGINHVYSGLTGRRDISDFDVFAQSFPAIEARNGQSIPCLNRAAAEFAARWNRTPLAGSDAHTLAGLGLTYTEIPHARSKDDFLAAMRAGRATAQGAHGNCFKLLAAISGIGIEMMAEAPWPRLLLAPLGATLPAIASFVCLRDKIFAAYWKHRTLDLPVRQFGRSVYSRGELA